MTNVEMSLALTDPSMKFNGKYSTPVSNYAIFHQSTIKDLFVRNLSLILGLRLDLEHQSLDYNMNSTEINYSFSTSMSKPANLTVQPAVNGARKDDYVQFLPKAALQYDFNNHLGNVYVSFSKGFRSGGYNIQMCSELAQTQMQGDMMRGVKNYCDNLFQGLIDNARNDVVRDMFSGIKEKVDNNIPDINAPDAKTLRYKPEYSLNYEIGTHLNLLERALQIDAAMFYMSTRNQQISHFSLNGLGRQMVNAGKSACCGAELGLRSSLLDDKMDIAASYGFTHSEFRKYNDGEAFTVGADVCGAGRIYWTEDNNTWQNFYATLGAHISAEMKNVKLNVWGKNITNSKYNVFYFESMSRGFEQHAAPCRFGADISFEF